ncbi:MAG: protoporphyrinogen oxidase, partial [Sphingobacteriales bacterium]
LGGGITGLSAAFYLEKAGAKNISIIECSALGGKMLTLKDNDFLVEAGPDSFITLKPHAVNLVEELGLSDELIQPKTSKFHILNHGKMLSSPKGLNMMVPTDMESFMQSELFTADGKERVLQEKNIPTRESDEDESFASFISRRFGLEMLRKYAEPLFGGIYATPSEELSMQATFPQFLQMEKKFGSLTAAVENQPKQTESNIQNRSPFVGLKNGIHSLADALMKSLKETQFVNKTIETLYIDRSKNAFTIGFSDGTTLEADQVIMALPVVAAQKLMANISADAAELLSQFTVSSSKIVTLAYKKFDIDSDVNATGFVAVRNGSQKMTASTWSSEKWPFRAPDNVLLARCFYNGNDVVDEVSDIQRAHKELAEIIHIKAKNPLRTWSYHWKNALPQYKVGHLQRVTALENMVEQIPNFQLAGSYLRGVGIPDCIRQGKEAAERLVMN